MILYVILFTITCILLISLTIYNCLFLINNQQEQKQNDTADRPVSINISLLEKKLLRDCKQLQAIQYYKQISKLARTCCADQRTVNAFETLYKTYYYTLLSPKRMRGDDMVIRSLHHFSHCNILQRRIRFYNRRGIYSFISRLIVSMYIIQHKTKKEKKEDVKLLTEQCIQDVL
jgi:hypothetical protein